MEEIKLSDTNNPKYIFVYAYDLDVSEIKSHILKYETFVSYLYLSNNEILIETDSKKLRNDIEYYLAVSKFPPNKDIYIDSIKKLKKLVFKEPEHLIEKSKAPFGSSNLVHQPPANTFSKSFNNTFIPNTFSQEKEYIDYAKLSMIYPNVNQQLLEKLLYKHKYEEKMKIKNIFDWHEISDYFFGVHDSTQRDIFIKDDNENQKSFIDDDVIPYLDTFRNIKRSFNNLRRGHLYREVIISLYNDNENYHFSVHVNENTKLEMVTNKETEIIGAFMQDGDEFLAIYYIEGHPNIITNDLYYSNSNGNDLPTERFPYYSINTVDEIIDVAFKQAAYMMMLSE